ncbi:MAG: rRNA (uracil1498-N3)-methyltransferase [Thermacetogenium sp.]|nr:rRNA (uracil1498-N3)-methyltransferase [Thermacetogenium sp.]
MHRFYLPSVPLGREFPLPREDSRKICRVLRLAPGDEILLWDAAGREFCALITRRGGQQVFARVLAERNTDVEPDLRVALVQGIPKGDKFEFIIQKATELGVWRIYPAVTERTVMRIPPEKRRKRLERWRVIAREAARQCGRVCIPEVMEISPLEDIWTGIEPEALKILLWERERCGLKEFLRENSPPPHAPVYLFVGPEGGLSEQEVERGRTYGAGGVNLGPRILRTETAGLVGLSLVLYEWGDLGG